MWTWWTNPSGRVVLNRCMPCNTSLRSASGTSSQIGHTARNTPCVSELWWRWTDHEYWCSWLKGRQVLVLSLMYTLKVLCESISSFFWEQVQRLWYGIVLLIKGWKKSRHNFINNLSSVICFGFVSHLQAEYKIVVWTVCYNAVSGFDEISSYIVMEYYKE